MELRKRYNLLVGLIILNVLITVTLFIINLLLISWINQLISLDQFVSIGIYLSIIILEPTRVSIMFISGIFTIRIKSIERKFKVIIITTLLFGIGFNIYYIIRFFILVCFAPIFSFLSMLFIYISFVLIIMQNHENDLMKSKEKRQT